MGKMLDSIRSYKRCLDGRRLRAVANARVQRVVNSGTQRRDELKKLYEEFCRNKSVDL